MPKADGHIIDMDMGNREVADTVQCCHCGKHHVVKDAILRASLGGMGFCAQCNHVTCGTVECQPCVPQEVQLENREKGRLDYKSYRPIVVTNFLGSERVRWE